MEPDALKFTVITSTFNAGELLRDTALSLADQTHSNLQWIIVDGASTDQTLDVVASMGDQVAKLISEPDSGIYCAWNKALPYIEGHWVLFLGAGDAIYDSEVLAAVASQLVQLPEQLTTVYGNVVIVGAGEDRLRTEEWQGLGGPWIVGRPVLPCHQGVFHRAVLFKDFKFDSRCKISADNEIMLREFLRGNGKKLDMVISRFRAGGISAQRNLRLRMIAESIWINMKLGIFSARPSYQLGMLVSNVVKHVFRAAGMKRI